MNQDFTVQKKAIFVWKKIRAEGFSWKKIPAQAVSEKKNRASWKFLHCGAWSHATRGANPLSIRNFFFSSTAPEKKQLRSLSQFLALQLTVGSSLRIFFTVPKPVRVTQQYFFTRGGSAPRSNPLPFYKPFFTKKVTLSYKLVYLLLTDGTPFTYLVQNFAFLLTAVNALTRHTEFCKADRTTWKLTSQDINTTPKELETERGRKCSAV